MPRPHPPSLRWAFTYLKAKEVGLFDEQDDSHLPRSWVQQMNRRASLVRGKGQRFFWMGGRQGDAATRAANIVQQEQRLQRAIMGGKLSLPIALPPPPSPFSPPPS